MAFFITGVFSYYKNHIKIQQTIGYNAEDLHTEHFFCTENRSKMGVE
jgi:hypothetical protein